MKHLFTRGFTLIEVVIYAGILIIISSSVISFTVWMVRAQGNLERQGQSMLEGERALAAISREVYGAVELYEPTSVLNSAEGQLSLRTTREVPPGEPFSYVDIFLCQNQVCVKREGQEVAVVTSQDVSVEELMFKKTGERSFQIVLVIEETELQSTFAMRAL